MTERKRFEAWARKNKDKDGCWLLTMKNSRGDYIDDSTYSAWQAWQARCPEGWQCVPVEPTTEMVDAASEMYMPFGDMALAIQAAIVYAPGESEEN
jgi:hypothetical protein|tara:strand:- start:7696 stop:7983 length:288 start_codon:yes stop_codon:yes gene_type:complete